MEKIKCQGLILDKDGRKTDPELAAAMKDMPAPDNIASLQSFLGLANYYPVFIQNIHDLRALPKGTIKERQTLGLDSGMLGGIWKNKENTDVKLISHTLQPGLGNHSS